MGLGLWGNVFQKLEEIFFKFLPQKAIEKRIEAIIKISNANGDGHGRVHDIRDPTVVDDAQLNQHVQEGEYLVGNPGEEKEKHDGHDYLKDVVVPRLVLLDGISLLEGLPNKGITRQDDQKREDEAQDVLGQAHPDGDDGVVGIVMESTDRDVGVLDEKDIPVDDGRQTGQAGQAPYDDAGDSGHKHRATEARFHGVDDGQVAVDAEAREQKHTGIEVETDAGRSNLTQVIAKGPAVFHSSVDGPQGQRQQKAQISQGQIQKENTGHRLHFHVKVDDDHYQAISKYSHHEDDAVECRNHDEYVIVPAGFGAVVLDSFNTIIRGRVEDHFDFLG